MFARADTFEIGGKTIVVPVPQGFVRVTEGMPAVHRFFEQIAAADPANDTLASYILESDVPTAMASEIPLLERTFVLKVSRQMQNLTVGKNEFAEFKKITRNQKDELLKNANPQIREAMSKISEGFSQDSEINFSMEISQVVPLAPHYEEENAIAFSMFANYRVAVEDVNETNIMSITCTILNAAGRVLFLYSYGPPGDLEWTRTASRDWGKRVMESNTQPPPGSPSGRRFDWNEIMGKGLVGGIAGGLVALIAMVFRRYFWRRPERGTD